MRAPFIFLICPALLLAAPALARDPIFAPPLDCTLGADCYIQNYVDADPGPGAADFTCGGLSYDGHKGTDFGLPTIVDMWAGVDVHPSAPGTVRAIRDGMEDFPQGRDGAPDVSGKECGNGVVIEHGDGWSTQYCHMRKDSIAVAVGQKVSKTTALGQIGLSGQTQFPHVHLAIRKDGQIVDPFNPTGVIVCGDTAAALGGTLWDRDMIYQAGGLLDVGVATQIPEYEQVKAGTATETDLTSESPALVVFGFAFGSRENDVLRLTLFGPEGEVVSRDMELDTAQAQVFRAVGKRASAPWPLGGYSATVRLLRNGSEIDMREMRFQITE